MTQNKAGHVTMHCVGNEVHFYSSNPKYTHKGMEKKGHAAFDGYVGSITVETEFTL
jgi:hypothetical protein